MNFKYFIIFIYFKILLFLYFHTGNNQVKLKILLFLNFRIILI